MIRHIGKSYTVKNAKRSGQRSTPNYSPAGEVIGILEERATPSTHRDSSGEEVDSSMEIRATGYDVEFYDSGDSEYWPTRLEHPQGIEYEVVSMTPEDSGVIVLMVERA